MKGLSLTVIIPTYNRKDILKKCLNALFNQTYPQSDYEIIVVDDGSTDGIEKVVKSLINVSSCRLRYLRQKHKGPATARNLGIKNANGKIILFIGDDIIATPNMLREHMEFHKRYTSQSIAILGYVTWPPDAVITPFMEYLYESGVQFGYSSIDDCLNVSYYYFYTSNISLNRQFLLNYGLFDEDFPFAAWEDIELGYRLTRQNLRILYNPQAIAYHEHPMAPKSFSKKATRIGYSRVILYQKHPELDAHLNSKSRFSIKDIPRVALWHLPQSLVKFFPKRYLYASYAYVISRYIRIGCGKRKFEARKCGLNWMKKGKKCT